MPNRATYSSLQHAAFRGVRLSEDDANAGYLLSTEAGWNQTADDWRFILRHGVCLGFEQDDGTLVASGAILPYENRFAWIGMVLVSASSRRQRVATLLMEQLLAVAGEKTWVPLLDATADGRKVYLPLGFRDLRSVTRWVRLENRADTPRAQNDVESASMVSLEPHRSWDARRFGADRSDLLRTLLASYPRLAREQSRGNAGFCLGRKGRFAVQLGPLVADSLSSALSLLRDALAHNEGPLLIDLVDGHAELETLLQTQGFEPKRHFVRMIQGDAPEPGRPESIWAITGPEFG